MHEKQANIDISFLLKEIDMPGLSDKVAHKQIVSHEYQQETDLVSNDGQPSLVANYKFLKITLAGGEKIIVLVKPYQEPAKARFYLENEADNRPVEKLLAYFDGKDIIEITDETGKTETLRGNEQSFRELEQAWLKSMPLKAKKIGEIKTNNLIERIKAIFR